MSEKNPGPWRKANPGVMGAEAMTPRDTRDEIAQKLSEILLGMDHATGDRNLQIWIATEGINEALALLRQRQVGNAIADPAREPQPSLEPEGCIKCEGEQFDGFICEGCGRRLVCWQDGSFSWLPPETDDEDDEPEPSSEASAPQTEEIKEQPMADDIPRRIRIDQQTPAEAAIRAAVEAVEAMPADVRLTDAVVLLGTARESVADYVDGIDNRRQPREPHAALVKDATRYRTLRRLLTNAVGGGVEVNDAKLVYETPEAGEVVRLYWYPDTPVGFCEVKADTLDDALDAALGKGDQT